MKWYTKKSYEEKDGITWLQLNSFGRMVFQIRMRCSIYTKRISSWKETGERVPMRGTELGVRCWVQTEPTQNYGLKRKPDKAAAQPIFIRRSSLIFGKLGTATHGVSREWRSRRNDVLSGKSMSSGRERSGGLISPRQGRALGRPGADRTTPLRLPRDSRQVSGLAKCLPLPYVWLTRRIPLPPFFQVRGLEFFFFFRILLIWYGYAYRMVHNSYYVLREIGSDHSHSLT